MVVNPMTVPLRNSPLRLSWLILASLIGCSSLVSVQDFTELSCPSTLSNNSPSVQKLWLPTCTLVHSREFVHQLLLDNRTSVQQEEQNIKDQIGRKNQMNRSCM